MKTKHLFFATALVASFASCTNEEIVEQQGVANVERPTVENVKLNFVGEGVDSRLAFGSKGYAWEASDVIGALLMDQPTAKVSDKDALWAEKYTLSNWVNTSYPFAYNADTKVWSNNAKMLEGNYFFAFPFSSYNGGREVKHSLTEQTQVGVASKVVAESYAKNQFFVGYSQIFGGTEAEDALEDVEMTSILGGLQFRIINNGSKTYHINKLVVSGKYVASELNFTPAMAEGTTDDFNYANYVGDDKATKDPYKYNENTVKAEGFNRADLLRALVVDKNTEAGKAQLNVTGTKAERAIAKGATGYAVVMVNPFTMTYDADGATSETLTLDIYTDEGVISVDLTQVINDITKDEYKGVLVDKKIEKVAHDVANTVVIKFNDDAVGSILSANIYNEKDLLHLIEWNAKSDIKVAPKATLVEDVEFTKEMFDLLKSNKNVTLEIDGEKELTLAANLPADVLDYEGLAIDAAVALVVEGTIEAAEDDKNKTEVIYNKMTIAEGGVLNVNNTKPVLPASIINEGTVNFGEKTIAIVNLTNEEEGIINIVKGADVKGFVNADEKVCFENNGTVNNNGYVERIINNADAVITLGEGATLKGLDNKKDATVNTAKDSQVVGDNAEDALINWVTGATVSVDGTGMVSATAPYGTSKVTKDLYEGTDINTLTLVAGQVTEFASDETGGIVNVIAAKGATLKVANGEALSLTKLIIEEDLTIITNNVEGETASSVTATTVEIAEEAELTNRGILNVTTWKNEGIVYNNGHISLPLGYTEANWGVVKYTAPNATQAPSADAVKAAALQEAITETVNKDGYSALTLAGLNGHIAGHMTASEAVYVKVAAYGLAYGANVTEAEYNAAIKAIKEANRAALTTALKATAVTTSLDKIATLFTETYKADGVTVEKTAKTVAYDNFRTVQGLAMFASYGELTNVVKWAFDALTDAQVDEILAAKAPNAYIWKGCNLQKAIAVWKAYDGISLGGNSAWDYTNAIDNENVVTRFVDWTKKALENATVAAKLSDAGVTIDTLPTFAKYTKEQFVSCK